jgi:hypothetical protein
MLDIQKRGTVAVGDMTWEYHGDDANANLFYVTPQPDWIRDDSGLPKIQLVEYQTSDDTNGSGYAVLEVQLSVPSSAMGSIQADIAKNFSVNSPVFQTLPVQTGTLVTLIYPDGEGGTANTQVNGTDFGSNSAVIQVQLSADQMKTIKGAMAGQGSSPFTIQYNIIVPAHMPEVEVDISFDATIAFQYEVTAYAHKKWAHDTTYTYDIQENLQQSNASVVNVVKNDPNVSEDVVTALREWGQSVIATQVNNEIQKALAIQEAAGGTQSFSINDIASFTESYKETETILWRLNPQSALQSFGDMGLTVDQINSLEPTIDKRQLVVNLTANVKFGDSDDYAPNDSIQSQGQAQNNPFMSKIQNVKQLNVTLNYPTLTDNQAKTVSFTSSDSNSTTWTTEWDDTTGGTYSLSYQVTYEDGTQFNGQIDNLSASVYTLGLDEVGTLNVTFDVSGLFANSPSNTSNSQNTNTPGNGSSNSLIDSVDVNFIFNAPNSAPFLQSAHLNAQTTSHIFSSVFDGPITTSYTYTITYNFKQGSNANPFTSDAKTQNGQFVKVINPDFAQPLRLFAIMTPTGDGVSILDAAVNIYYDDKPYFPDVPASSALPAPNSGSPIHFDFSPDGSSTTASANVTLFTNSKLSPLTIGATILDSEGNEVTIGPIQFDPQSAQLISLAAKNQISFLKFDPSIVQWNNAGGSSADLLNSVRVRIPAVRYHVNDSQGKDSTVTTYVTAGDQDIVVDLQRHVPYAVFYQIKNLPNGYHGLEFDWQAEYVYTSGTKYVAGTQVGTTTTLPISATAATPPWAPSGGGSSNGGGTPS